MDSNPVSLFMLLVLSIYGLRQFAKRAIAELEERKAELEHESEIYFGQLK